MEKKEGICGKSEIVRSKEIMPIKQYNKSSGYSAVNSDSDGNMLEMESNKIVHINKL